METEVKIIHFPDENNTKHERWVVEVNPNDGSYFPICRYTTARLAGFIISELQDIAKRNVDDNILDLLAFVQKQYKVFK